MSGTTSSGGDVRRCRSQQLCFISRVPSGDEAATVVRVKEHRYGGLVGEEKRWIRTTGGSGSVGGEEVVFGHTILITDI
jgi:hypothetical protein